MSVNLEKIQSGSFCGRRFVDLQRDWLSDKIKKLENSLEGVKINSKRWNVIVSEIVETVDDLYHHNITHPPLRGDQLVQSLISKEENRKIVEEVMSENLSTV